jgi:hypothetical protein
VFLMKKLWWIIIIFAAILGVLFFLRFILGGNEDGWIKDSRGVWVKHGNPSETPLEAINQGQAVTCAEELYSGAIREEQELNSQCLGTCQGYAVDIVHVPRTGEDNMEENQCSDFREGKVSRFIELDKSGEIVRIV